MTKNTVSQIVAELSHAHRRRHVTFVLKDFAYFHSMAFLGFRKRRFLRWEIVVIWETRALDVILSAELARECFAGLQQMP